MVPIFVSVIDRSYPQLGSITGSNILEYKKNHSAYTFVVVTTYSNSKSVKCPPVAMLAADTSTKS
jgi:hypothetical protein